VEKARLVPVSDPSNSDSRFDRARLRKHLADANWLDREGWGRSAALLAEAERALQYFLIEERLTLMKMIDPTDPKWVFVRPDKPARPDYADIEQVVYYFTLFDAEISRSDASSLVKKLKRNMGGNFAGVLVTPGEYQGKPAWIFQRENPRKTG
jgi:tRNA(Ile)-lysidine synthase